MSEKRKKRKKKKKGIGLRTKLVFVSMLVMMIPLALVLYITREQNTQQGHKLREMSVIDTTIALNKSARENLERKTTDTAATIAGFLYQRDQDVLLLAQLMPSDEAYMVFSENRNGNLMTTGEWVLAEDGMSWVQTDPFIQESSSIVLTESENNETFEDSFNHRSPEFFARYHELFPLYDEIAFIDLHGQELFKFVSSDSAKKNFPLNNEKVDVSDKTNTYIKAETYWDELQKLEPGEIYVSDVIGAYVSTNYAGMYTPGALRNNVPYDHPNFTSLQEIANLPVNEFMEMARQQAFAGFENPVGQRFEGIVRWATPVTDFEGEIWGYVTMALNHDFIMEFVDYMTPMSERYSILPNAHDGNYVSVWDNKGKSIAYPRHAMIAGYDPQTGEPHVYQPENLTFFVEVSQIEGWMELTEDGGSGSFYVYRNDLYKATTAGAVQYYTGKYSPDVQGNNRGFALVAISAGLDEFTKPAVLMEERLINAIDEDSRENARQLFIMGAGVFILIFIVMLLVAYSFTRRINKLIAGMARFQSGERQFRMHSKSRDEIGMLADSFDEMADNVESSINKAEQAGEANKLSLTETEFYPEEDESLSDYIQITIDDEEYLL